MSAPISILPLPADPSMRDVEMAVIGMMMTSGDAGLLLSNALSAEDFTTDLHQSLFATLRRRLMDGEPCDLVAMSNVLLSGEDASFAANAATLTECCEKGWNSGNASGYAGQLRDASRRRAAYQSAIAIVNAVRESTDWSECRPAVERAVMEMEKTTAGHEIITASQAVDRYGAWMNAAAAAKAYECGIEGLDAMLKPHKALPGGFRATDLAIIAGRSGGGKTALLGHIMRHNAERGIPGAIISLEMSAEQLAGRLLLTAQCLHGPLMSDVLLKVRGLPLYIVDRPDMTPEAIRSVSRLLRRRHKVEVIGLDFLQLVTPDKDDRRRDRHEIVTSVARQLKNLAKETGMAAIALSQVNDEGKLAEARAIRNAADQVIKIVERDNGTFLRIDKQRNGPDHSRIPEDGEEPPGVRAYFDREAYHWQ